MAIYDFSEYATIDLERILALLHELETLGFSAVEDDAMFALNQELEKREEGGID